MHVKAAPGHRVPTDNDPYTYIEGAEAVDVPDTSYYRRRVAAQELLTVKKPRASAKQPAQDSTE